jgi:hypothetical protein
MKRLTAVLGYTAAVLTVAAAFVTPFLLYNLFTAAVAKAGFHVDPVYTGGDPVRTVDRPGYRIAVHRRVEPHALLSRAEPFVQLVWRPAAALPDRVWDAIDLDGDSRPDLVVSFRHANDPRADLRFSVVPLNPSVQGVRGVGKIGFSCLIARVGDAVVVRVPLK